MKTYFITILLIVYSFYSFSQKKTIQLLDQETNEVIANATFVHGSQAGVSDEQGTILFELEEGQDLQVSHVNYGSQIWNPTALQAALSSKQILLKAKVSDLMPVTVVSVRSANTSSLDFSARDHLSHDGATILKEIPSIGTIQKAGNYGFDPVFRGFKYDQLNVVLNGAQSATAACPNRMDPPTSQMAPNMLEQVEILKGPYSLRYGAGLGATINFKSAPLSFKPQSLNGRFSTSYESNGDVARGEGMIGYASKIIDVGLYSSYAEGNDYQSGSGETMQADFKRGSIGTHLGARLSPDQTIRISANYNVARDADFPALAMDLRKDDTWMFNARHEMEFNQAKIKSWNTTLFGSFVDHTMDNLLKDLNPRMMNAATDAETFNYGGRSEITWKGRGGLAYSGVDVKVEGAKGERTREFLMGDMMGNVVTDNAWQQGQISKTGLFTEYHFLNGAMDVILSGRLEYNSASIKDPEANFASINEELELVQVNPGVSLGLAKSMVSNVNTSLWLGRVQRSGSLTERYINYFAVGNDPYELVGNPALEPEVNYQLDFTNQWTKNNFSLNVDLFVSYLENYISSVIDTTLSPVIPSSPGVRRFVNIDQAFKTGFELGFANQLSDQWTHRLDAAYTYAQDLERDEPLPEIAPMDIRYRIAGKLVSGRLRPEVMLRHVLDQERISEEYGETATPSFTTVDLNLSYAIFNNATLTFNIQNLFDENYYEHLTRSVRGSSDPIFARGRSFNFSLLFDFM